MSDVEEGLRDGSESPLFTPRHSPSPRQSEQIQDASTVQASWNVVDTTGAAFSPIKGLYYVRDILNDEEAYTLIENIRQCAYFDAKCGRDQAVLFGSPIVEESVHIAGTKGIHGNNDDAALQGLPLWSQDLLKCLEQRLFESKLVPAEVLNVVFLNKRTVQPIVRRSRQFILNTYVPGQGIASHIDIPHRFLDGILIISLGSGISMDFRQCQPSRSKDNEQRSNSQHQTSIYLQPKSICILTGDSRWNWTHGIAARTFDIVKDVSDNFDYVDNVNIRQARDANAKVQKIDRGPRLSITIRWLKVRQEEDDSEQDDLQTHIRPTSQQ